MNISPSKAQKQRRRKKYEFSFVSSSIDRIYELVRAKQQDEIDNIFGGASLTHGMNHPECYFYGGFHHRSKHTVFCAGSSPPLYLELNRGNVKRLREKNEAKRLFMEK